MVRRLLVVLAACAAALIPSAAWADANLVVGRPGDLTVENGSTITAPVVVGNDGDATANGVMFYLRASSGLRSDARYANCQYLVDDRRTAMFCRFEQPVESGRFYTLSPPIELDVAAEHELGELYTYTWCTAETAFNCEFTGTPGEGPILTLVPVERPAATALIATDNVFVTVTDDQERTPMGYLAWPAGALVLGGMATWLGWRLFRRIKGDGHPQRTTEGR
ncbi:hypothetical protein Afil01_21670 [Actinorhabdospora filicis]|uniref:Uncharacterized protein n=1 Tax=Actinorhabdospora filicis TaxID=1785913 RepID=A0A9W6WA77_9ACTN|nr:hypothetical protein [Actinorhabdospora filicis]GLZ77360.1 hypothetical protein Afil01_21670 [Actinorhabdospora filicis]